MGYLMVRNHGISYGEVRNHGISYGEVRHHGIPYGEVRHYWETTAHSLKLSLKLRLSKVDFQHVLLHNFFHKCHFLLFECESNSKFF